MRLYEFFNNLTEDDNQYTISKQDLDHYSRYYSKLNFKTPEEARDYIFRNLEHSDRQSFSQVTGINGPEKNRWIADNIPLYQSGKSWKIGKRVRSKGLSWDDFDIDTYTTEELTTGGWVNPFDLIKVEGPVLVPIRKLNPTETHSQTEQGQRNVSRIVMGMKENKWFRAIVIDDLYNVIDGHHRIQACLKLKFTKIPCQIVYIDDGLE